MRLNGPVITKVVLDIHEKPIRVNKYEFNCVRGLSIEICKYNFMFRKIISEWNLALIWYRGTA